ncbi:MAG: type VI secretion system baseplate subunit TssG, partial [Gemmatimonadetes bacterium]|nr:type VI secretion system baseplate subunit TssG [Gemmatimonadota bacterium]
MGTESRVPPADLKPEAWEATLNEAPESFGFFQAVRLLHRRLEDRKAVGEFADPSEEVVRFSANPSLAFPAGEIQYLRLDPDGRADMMTNFLGLVGHMGVLPTQYSLLLDNQAAEEGDPDGLR